MSGPTDLPRPPLRKYSLVDYVFQFITITFGVLIALLINGLVEWNDNRLLVNQARVSILREIQDNKEEVDLALAGMQVNVQALDSAIKRVSDRLADKRTTTKALSIGLTLTSLSTTAWRTAERTGALNHMDYIEVQRYSVLYDFQDMVAEQQHDLLGRFGAATGTVDPGRNLDDLNAGDLETIRNHLVTLHGMLTIHFDLTRELGKNLEGALKR